MSRLPTPTLDQDQETIKLLVSELVGCDYCAAAHARIARSTGLTPEVVQQIRTSQPTGDAIRIGNWSRSAWPSR